MHPMRRSRLTISLPLAAIHGLLAASALAFQDGGHAGHASGQSKPAASAQQPDVKPSQGDPYMLATDPVSRAALGPIEKQVITEHDGRELRFVSAENAKTFKADPGKYLPAVDAQMIAQQRPFYPLDACIVSDKKLGGEMGEPIDFIYRNRLVRFCCTECKPKFLADPAKYLATIDKAVIASQGLTYPLKTCPVSGDALAGDMGPPIDAVFGNRLVRFCCKDCPKEFRKDPLKFLGQLPAAGAAQKEHGEHSENEEKPGHDHAGGH